LITQIDEKFISDVFFRKIFEGKNDKNEISRIRSSLLKIYGFFSGFRIFNQLC